jgi:hypothetical protein
MSFTSSSCSNRYVDDNQAIKCIAKNIAPQLIETDYCMHSTFLRLELLTRFIYYFWSTGIKLTADLAVEVVEERIVLELLLDNEPEGSKHGNTTVGNFRLPPSPQLPNRTWAGCSTGQKIGRVKNVGEWLRHSWQRPGVCRARKTQQTCQNPKPPSPPVPAS